MSSAFFSALRLLLILAVISSAVLSLQTNDDLGEIFRPYRGRNVKSSERETSRSGVSKLVPENQKKVDCYRRGGYRTGGGGGGIPPVIIIGGGGGNGAIPGMVIPGAAGGAGGGGVPATGSGGSAPGPAGGTSGGGAGTAADATTVPTA
ncbi:loricrin-like [Coccinella septempunctata]|uniref:loricrin-like n=1 Tax=Coccinella septempunctata TaxID=41139 RepID=UPI001D071541|nr:loricrin-like [Coccinella septempunctata]